MPNSFAHTITDLDLDHESITSNCSDISTGALHNIRNRMVSSLRLINDLEQQVQTVPELKKQVDELRSDNDYLTGLIKRNADNQLRIPTEEIPPDVFKRKGPAPQPPKRRSVSVSLSVPNDEIPLEPRQISPVPSKRVTRSPVVTRDVGVTTQKATTQSIGTNSETRLYTAEELESIVQQVVAKQNKFRANRCVNSATQLGPSVFLTKASRSTSAQTKPIAKSISVSTMTLLDTPKKAESPCLKCIDRQQFDSTCIPTPVISLEFMDILPPIKKSSVNKSAQTPIVSLKNVEVQATVPIKSYCSKASQSSAAVGIHFGCQNSPQPPVLKNKLTETLDLLVHHHKASGPDQTSNRTKVTDQSTNTSQLPRSVQVSTSTDATQSCDVGSITDTSFAADSSQIQFNCPNGCPKDSVYCEACKHAIRSISREIGLTFTSSLQKSGSSHSLSGSSPVSEYSRIPRPKTQMSPRPERRFERQTTYSVPKKAVTPTRSRSQSEEDFVKTCPAEEILR